jgi:Cu/Ag efflux pump CusA
VGDDTDGHVDILARLEDALTIVIGREAEPRDANYGGPALTAEGRPFEDALREASIGRVRPKFLTAAMATLGLLPLLLLPLHGTEIERPLAVVMVGGLVASTVFTLLALPTFYLWGSRLR